MSTLAQLRTRVRYNLDETTATFWSDNEIDSWLNESYRYYWNFIIQAFESFFLKTAYISFDNNAAGEYTLPTDFYKLKLILRNLGGETVPLRYFERYDNSVPNITTISSYNLPTYRFRNGKLLFEPAPAITETNALTIEYIKTLTTLSSVQDVDSEFPSLAEDCMVIRATLKAKAKEEMVDGRGVDSDPFLKDLMSSEQMLKESLELKTTGRVYAEQFGEDENNIIQY